ncbi:hypothetical protein ACIQ9Q_09655 [Streptomyces sp. NPDC094438]|uniref:hypothetical protein n=1 Tax=Streptomyces sp. NPDC094438 TaxID=3366061 RepID=UPI0038264903
MKYSVGSPGVDELLDQASVILGLSANRVKSILDGTALPIDAMEAYRQRIQLINAYVFYAEASEIETTQMRAISEQCREEARDLLGLLGMRGLEQK